MKRSSLIIAPLLIIIIAQSAFGGEGEDVRKFRQQHEAELRAPDSLLNAVALETLHDGEHPLYATAAGDLTIERDAGAKQVATLSVLGAETKLVDVRSRKLLLDDKPASSGTVLGADDSKHRDTLRYGSCTAFLHTTHHGNEHALRVLDPKTSKYLKAFRGNVWFPIDERYRVSGTLEPPTPGAKIQVATEGAGSMSVPSLGTIHFHLLGRDLTLQPMDIETLHGTKMYFIVFRDATAGKTTYGASRFLYAPITESRSGTDVELDFNRAENPPCAFTPYATCPLPPKGNILPIAIEAGEKKPSDLE